MAGLRLVDFYKQQGRYDSAIARLNYVIKLSSVYNSKYYPTKQSAASLLRFSGTTKLQTMRSDVFVELSDLYRRQNDPEKALACLEKADSCYMRFSSDCGNWLIQCLTQLSLKYADFYLSRGDTTSAINRLLKFCFWQEPYSKEATVRLRGLLLSRYTALAISRELKRGVAYIYGKKKKKDPDSGETIHFTLFGYQYQWIPFSTAEELRKFLAWSPNFKLLRDGETANIAVGK
jgi:tetratricopeptide (TPR) repeat protein